MKGLKAGCLKFTDDDELMLFKKVSQTHSISD